MINRKAKQLAEAHEWREQMRFRGVLGGDALRQGQDAVKGILFRLLALTLVSALLDGLGRRDHVEVTWLVDEVCLRLCNVIKV